MAVEESVLNNDIIKKIMIKQYGISVEAIKKLNRGSANVFEIFSKGSHYILKEFQSKIAIDNIKIEYMVAEYLRKDGVSTPKYILNKNGELYFKFKKKLLIVQKFIEGQVFDSNTSNQEQIIESAHLYGKIIKSLENALFVLRQVLIITNKHYLNFFELPKEIKIQVSKLKEKIKEVYEEIYNSDVLFFEHGSAQSGYAGASIDHAHLHCIPYKFDLMDTLNEKLGQAEECNILSPEKQFNNELSYVKL